MSRTFKGLGPQEVENIAGFKDIKMTAWRTHSRMEKRRQDKETSGGLISTGDGLQSADFLPPDYLNDPSRWEPWMEGTGQVPSFLHLPPFLCPRTWGRFMGASLLQQETLAPPLLLLSLCQRHAS